MMTRVWLCVLTILALCGPRQALAGDGHSHTDVHIHTYDSAEQQAAFCPASLHGRGPAGATTITWSSDRRHQQGAEQASPLVVQIGKTTCTLKSVSDSIRVETDSAGTHVRPTDLGTCVGTDVEQPITSIVVRDQVTSSLLCAPSLRKTRGLLYVGQIGPPQTSAPQRDRLSRVHNEIVAAIHAGQTDPSEDMPYANVLTFQQIQSDRSDFLTSVTQLEKFAAVSMRGAVDSSRKEALKRDFRDYLRVSVHGDDANILSIELELFDIDGWQRKAYKLVGECGLSTTEVLADLRDAVFQLVRGKADEAPNIVPRAGPSATLEMGAALTLDGCVEFPGFSGQIVDVTMPRAERNTPARS